MELMMTDAVYEAWISEHWATPEKNNGYGKCKEACEEMVLEFPHLRMQHGFYHDSLWGLRPHWWLVDTDDSVVDPTRFQFPTRGGGEYRPLKLEQEPIGKCLYCGEWLYVDGYDSSFCSPDCARLCTESMLIPNFILRSSSV